MCLEIADALRLGPRIGSKLISACPDSMETPAAVQRLDCGVSETLQAGSNSRLRLMVQVLSI